MMEKNSTDSMTTVQMKADYAASEIYSTTSEAPPVRTQAADLRIEFDIDFVQTKLRIWLGMSNGLRLVRDYMGLTHRCYYHINDYHYL